MNFTLKQLKFEIGNVEHRVYGIEKEKEELESYLLILKESLNSGNYKEDKNEQD